MQHLSGAFAKLAILDIFAWLRRTTSSGQLKVITMEFYFNMMKTVFNTIMPVLPSSDIARDVKWYKDYTGFEAKFADKMYAVLYRDELFIHLQWHEGTEADPLPNGSIIRIDVQNIRPLFGEFVGRGTVTDDDLITSTPWHTNEFGFSDLNKNLIFIMEGS
jgi:hypothetical protein